MPSYTGRAVAYRTMARIVMHELGFPTFRHLAAVSGVNHKTVSDVMYRRKKIFPHARRGCVMRLYECIYSAWNQKKYGFDKHEQELYRNWLNSWRARCLGEIVMWTRPGRRKDPADMVRKDHAKRRERRVTARQAELAKALRVFE